MYKAHIDKYIILNKGWRISVVKHGIKVQLKCKTSLYSSV